MMSRYFGLSSELTGAIAKRLPHAKISFLGLTDSSINSLHIYIYILYIKMLGFFLFCLSELIEELASRRNTKIGM